MNTQIELSTIERLISRLSHRGPDDQDYFTGNEVGLIHTRLSILDVSRLGSQPYSFENLVLVYNGEIYNFREIKSELTAHGYSFISNSDTEVLIKAFHKWGPDSVSKFVGMFAFAIYDTEKELMFLFRDRLGVKPLYYAHDNRSLYFASELKALMLFPIATEIDLQATVNYFRFGFIPHDQTIFQSVSKLEPGHFLVVGRNKFEKKKYWEVPPIQFNEKKEAQWLTELDELMLSSFKYRTVSDVPVAVLLSGGIDSSLLTAMLQKTEGNLHTFTVGFSESKFDESAFARNVARTLGTHHTEKILRLDEARGMFNEFYSIYDEPFADTSGIPTAIISKIIKDNNFKVILSADGGDELFAGYPHYQVIQKRYNQLKSDPVSLKKLLFHLTPLLLRSIRSRIYSFNFEHRLNALEELYYSRDYQKFFEFNISNQTIGEIGKLIPGATINWLPKTATSDNLLRIMMEWDLKYFLPDDLMVKIDRASMYYGIECREPFLDHRLIEFTRNIPNNLLIRDGQGKHLLRELLKKYLPDQNFVRKKQGFSIPMFEWFTRELDTLFAQYFSASFLSNVPFLDAKVIVEEYAKYRYYKKESKQYNIEKMWRIVSFLLWWEAYMKPRR